MFSSTTHVLYIGLVARLWKCVRSGRLSSSVNGPGELVRQRKPNGDEPEDYLMVSLIIQLSREQCCWAACLNVP